MDAPAGPTRGVRDVLRRVSVIQGVLLAVVLAVASIALFAYRSADDRARTTEEVLLQLETLKSSVLSAETDLRGFILIGDPTLRTDLEAESPRIDAALVRLREVGDAEMEPSLADIGATMDEWRTEFADRILAFLDVGDYIGALELSKTGAGKVRIDRARVLVADLSDAARADLAVRRDDTRRVGQLGLAVAIAAVIGLVLTAFAGRRRLAQSIGVPLRDLSDAADRLGAGDLTTRATAAGVTEIDRVAHAFNAMAAQVETTVTDLLAVDRLKSEFVSVVSHELRTPLTSIRGSLGLLASGAMGEMPEDAAQMLAIAVNNTDRLVRLINDILDLERIEAGRDTMDIRPCSAARVVLEAGSGVAGAAEAAGVQLVTIPVDADVNGDPDRLVQALTNLAGNAIKFSEPGGKVTIEGLVEGDEVVLRVLDEGRGIPPEMLESVFDRFRQVDATDAREKGGTGLGLAITKSIVDLHGGRIDVTSTVGEGSCFAIVLPRHVSVGAARPSHRGGDVVLVVEDEADIRQILTAELSSVGFDVVSAASASEALERCRDSAPAALVLDVRLAEGDGFEVVHALRLDDRLRNLPTVVYTVVDLDAAAKDALRLGETVFIVKGTERDRSIAAELLDLLVRQRRSA